MGRHIKFDHLNTHGDFTSILNQFGINYEKRGAQLRALCPLHDDRTPSLSITLEARGEAKENTWHCFGCKDNGTIIDFVARMTSETLSDDADLVAQLSRCGLALTFGLGGCSETSRKMVGTAKFRSGFGLNGPPNAFKRASACFNGSAGIAGLLA